MEFKAVELHRHLVPVFEGENPQAWLRAAFLRDTETSTPALLELFRQVKESGQAADWAGSEVWLDCLPDHLVITHQWIYAQEGNEAEIEISLDEAERLLRAWHAALAECRKQ